MKIDKDKLKLRIKEVKLPKLLDFFRWMAIDIYRRIKYGRRLSVYGIWCFVGIYGGGKTVSLVYYLEAMRKKYGDKIYICTNFFYKGQDFPLTHWKDITKDYDRPVIFAYDELQNEFNSREYRNFPMLLMHELTQNRKEFGKQIVYTTQDYETVDKNFRRLTNDVVTCRTYFGRLTRCRYFKRANYEHLASTVDTNKKFKIKPFKAESFVQSDYLRNQYDSFKRLDSVRSLEYNDRVLTA